MTQYLVYETEYPADGEIIEAATPDDAMELYREHTNPESDAELSCVLAPG